MLKLSKNLFTVPTGTTYYWVHKKGDPPESPEGILLGCITQ